MTNGSKPQQGKPASAGNGGKGQEESKKSAPK